MKYKTLGRTGLQVSELCFGTMSFGGDADETTSEKMYKATRDAGINFYDCADVYNGGEAERILGKLIKHERNELVVTSKCAEATSDNVNHSGTNRRHVKQAVEKSLQRLQTDWLDVLLVHRWDPLTPLDETLRGLEDLVREGKVLHIGASNYAAWQVQKGLGISARNHWTRFEVIQPMYNLVRRQVESELLPMAQAEEVGVMTYGPVGGGLLSGKYRSANKPNDSRLIKNQMYMRRYDEEWVHDVADQFCDYASEINVHPVSLAVAWVKANAAVTCPIIGARNLQQLQPSLDSMQVEMTTERRDAISALSRTPALATDRLEERTVV